MDLQSPPDGPTAPPAASTPRTPFVYPDAEPTAELVEFPRHAVAFAHGASGRLALVDWRGRYIRFDGQGELHAYVVEHNRLIQDRAEAIVARKAEEGRCAAFDAASPFARLPFEIADWIVSLLIASRPYLMCAAVAGCCGALAVFSLVIL